MWENETANLGNAYVINDGARVRFTATSGDVRADLRAFMIKIRRSAILVRVEDQHVMARPFHSTRRTSIVTLLPDYTRGLILPIVLQGAPMVFRHPLLTFVLGRMILLNVYQGRFVLRLRGLVHVRR